MSKVKVNLLIATWSGGRYNPSKNYLKVLLKRVFELRHDLEQITIIVPEGSWDEEYYRLEEYMKHKVAFLHRPANDRSYGQFVYAYQQYTDQFDYYIICEDDYVPNIDNFDSILVDLIEKKRADYLCGKYARQVKSDRDRAIHNQGIVRSSSFKKLLEHTPHPKYPVMGPEDGTEQLIFSEHFTDADMVIRDYADEYSVPYWAKTLMYFSEKRGYNTIFVPYQCVALPKDSHFLSTVKYTQYRSTRHEHFLRAMQLFYPNIFRDTPPSGLFIIEEPQIDLYPHNGMEESMGVFDLVRKDSKLYIQSVFIHPKYVKEDIDVTICERISWENRGENLYMTIENLELCKKLLKQGWINVDIEGVSVMCKNLTQKEYTLSTKSLMSNI